MGAIEAILVHDAFAKAFALRHCRKGTGGGGSCVDLDLWSLQVCYCYCADFHYFMKAFSLDGLSAVPDRNVTSRFSVILGDIAISNAMCD